MQIKTLGGRQFWGDVRHFRGWRIQQNVFTGHHRLLDPKDRRHAFGTLSRCAAALDDLKTARGLPALSGKAAITIHGITRSSKMFSGMRLALERAGYCTVGFDYPSTRLPLERSADYLHRVIESLEGVDEIYLVAHSLGGLVTRAYLKEHRDPRIKRMVMLGVPNKGAEMADLLRRSYAFRLVFGPAGQQLMTGDEAFIPKLPVPDFEFAVIAGSRGKDTGYNPLIRGDNDLLVSVESAQLPGAAGFRTVRALHTHLPSNRQVIEATLEFLATGRMASD